MATTRKKPGDDKQTAAAVRRLRASGMLTKLKHKPLLVRRVEYARGAVPCLSVAVPRGYYVALEQAADALASIIDCSGLEFLAGPVADGRRALDAHSEFSPEGTWLVPQPEEEE